VGPVVNRCVCICENASYAEKGRRRHGNVHPWGIELRDQRLLRACVPGTIPQGGQRTTDVVNLSNHVLDGILQSYYLLSFLPSQLAGGLHFQEDSWRGRDAWAAGGSPRTRDSQFPG
jgi:hypothetical protein